MPRTSLIVLLCIVVTDPYTPTHGRYQYKGVVVAADHAVIDADGPDALAFVRVVDAAGAEPFANPGGDVLHDLITSGHRIVTPTAVFADYLEADDAHFKEYWERTLAMLNDGAGR